MDINIENIIEKHRLDWDLLWKKYLQFYKTSATAEVCDKTFERLINKDEKSCEGFIAHIGSQAVGIVHCVYHLHTQSINKICYLHDLYTIKESRRKGVARKLIQYVYDKADDLELYNVYWSTQSFNTQARKLYDDLGVLTDFVKYKRD